MRVVFLAALMAGLSLPVVAQETADTHLTMCLGDNEKACEFDKQQFKKAYAAAYKRDYQGQRNVSYCLSAGCGGAVQKNAALGCAWRLVILASGSSRVDSTDIMNKRVYCDRLAADEQGTARAHAEELMRKIYKRNL